MYFQHYKVTGHRAQTGSKNIGIIPLNPQDHLWDVAVSELYSMIHVNRTQSLKKVYESRRKHLMGSMA